MILFEFGIVSSSLAFPFICPFVSLILDKLMEILNVPNHIFLLSQLSILVKFLVLFYIKFQNVSSKKIFLLSRVILLLANPVNNVCAELLMNRNNLSTIFLFSGSLIN